jgi:hypothetical protein
MRSSGYPNFAIVATIRGTSSGKEMSFKGASIIHVEGDKIRSDECYFDRKALEISQTPIEGFCASSGSDGAISSSSEDPPANQQELGAKS